MSKQEVLIESLLLLEEPSSQPTEVEQAPIDLRRSFNGTNYDDIIIFASYEVLIVHDLTQFL